jgi:hypothetical protein
MTDPKQKPSPSLREPKPKKKLGLSVPQPLRLPHEDLVKPIDKTDKLTMTSQSSLTSQSSNTSQTSQTIAQPVAPVRDFSKVANSIAREAIPAGVFKGKSKQLYDYLYSVTRGAVVPSRTVRLSRPRLMKAAGIGSRVTFDANVERLCQVGLISIRSIAGEHEGNEYTVYLPEEIISMPSQTRQTSLTSPAHKLDRLVCLETSQTSHSSSIEDSTTSEMSNTSFKTINDDDDGVDVFWTIISEAARQVIGRDLPKTDAERERWRECAEVLADELRRAAERAGSVSSVPAFFTAHLRRRFKTGQGSRTEPRSDSEMPKRQIATLSAEQKVMKAIKELRMLHVGDPDYQESDLIDDLKYRCEREGIAWDENQVRALMSDPKR